MNKANIKKSIVILLLITFGAVNAQVGIGIPAPNPSAQLDVSSLDKGVLIPRVALRSSSDTTTIASGNIESLLVYNTATVGDISPGYYYWSDKKWIRITTTEDLVEQMMIVDSGRPTITGRPGNLYVNTDNGDMYTWNPRINNWEQSIELNLNKGFGMPTATSPASPDTGDIYVDGLTGNIYTYDGSSWIAQNEKATHSGTGAPTATSPASPDAGDIYVDALTGNIYIYNGSAWITQNEKATHSGTGPPTTTNQASPLAGDLYVDQNNGDIYTYDGSTWIAQNEKVTHSGTGVPTATSPANPDVGDIYIDGLTGNKYTYNGSTWITQNEKATHSGTGAPTATSQASPDAGDLYVDQNNGDIYTYDGSTWIAQKQDDGAWENDATNTRIELATLSDGSTARPTGKEFVALDNGNVGIGTDAPTQELHVKGSARVDEFIYDENNEPGTTGQVLSTTSTGIDWIDAQGIASYADATARNADITSPSKGQTVFLEDDDALYSYDGSDWISQKKDDDAWENDATNTRIELATLSDGSTARPTGKEFVALDNGNVGIGTDAPTQELHVKGSARVDEFIYDENNEPGTTGQVLSTTSTGIDWIDAQGIASYADASARDSGITSPSKGQTVFLEDKDALYTYNGNTWISQNHDDGAWENDAANTRIELGTLSDGSTARPTGKEFVALDNGNVGIGTDTPTQELHVEGSARVDEFIYDENNEPGTTGQVLSTTATGIDWIDAQGIASYADATARDSGNTSPSKGQTVFLEDKDALYTYNGNTWIAQKQEDGAWENDAANTRIELGTLSDGSTARPTGKEFVALDNGNVGIGTDTPTQELHVEGSARVDEFIYDENNEPGTTGQVLSTTSTGIDWIDAQGITSYADATARNADITSPSKGQTVFLEDKDALYTYNGNTWIAQKQDDGAWENDAANTRIELGTLSDGSTARPTGKEFVALDNGNVGIGTDAPTQELHVEGSARVDEFIYDENNEPGTTGQVLSTTATGIDWIDAQGIASYADASARNTDITSPSKGQTVFLEDKDALFTYNGNDWVSAEGITSYADASARDSAITSPSKGQTVFLEDMDALFTYDGSDWISQKKDDDAWENDAANSRIELGTLSDGSSARPTGKEFVALDNGNVGIGTATPKSKLEIDGAATNTAAKNFGAAFAIDFSVSNLAISTRSAGSFWLTNIKDGGTYTLVVRGSSAGTAQFTSTGFTFRTSNNGLTTANTETIYTFIVMGTTVYYVMNTGFF